MTNLLKSPLVPITLEEKIEATRQEWERHRRTWGDDSPLTRDTQKRLEALQQRWEWQKEQFRKEGRRSFERRTEGTGGARGGGPDNRGGV